MTGGAPGPRASRAAPARHSARGAGHVADLSQFARHQVLRRFRHDAHRDVDLVAQQVLHAVLEQHVQHDVGIVTLELQQPGRHDELAVAAGHAEPDLALRRLAQALHRLARGDQFILDAAAVLVEPQPDLRGFHAARTAPHQLHANRTLQLAQVVADIGAGHLGARPRSGCPRPGSPPAGSGFGVHVGSSSFDCVSLHCQILLIAVSIIDAIVKTSLLIKN